MEQLGKGTPDVVGVDGCKAGWLAVRLYGVGLYETKVFETFEELVSHYKDADLILVDIPIGLPEDTNPRECDPEARKVLGQRRSSVFPAPTRQAVIQARKAPKDYAAACQKQLSVAGNCLSMQAFAIAPKIGEVDALLLEKKPIGLPPIREIHPEVCFWALNGKKPMQHPKKQIQGKIERGTLLGSCDPQSPKIIDTALKKYPRSAVAEDDVLDALAAAITASHGHGALQTIPYAPSLDAKGLPMEMVYWVPPSP